jgi:predicted nucleic acid-binding Zn ribbon protein
MGDLSKMFQDDDDKRIAVNDAMSSKELIKIFLNKLHVEQNDELNLVLNWNKIVQGELSKHLKVKEIKFNTVIIRADHPAWAQKGNLKKVRILSKIQKEFPSLGIQSIKIICG